MDRKTKSILIAGLLLLTLFSCAKKKAVQNSGSAGNAIPPQHVEVEGKYLPGDKEPPFEFIITSVVARGSSLTEPLAGGDTIIVKTSALQRTDEPVRLLLMEQMTPSSAPVYLLKAIREN